MMSLECNSVVQEWYRQVLSSLVKRRWFLSCIEVGVSWYLAKHREDRQEATPLWKAEHIISKEVIPHRVVAGVLLLLLLLFHSMGFILWRSVKDVPFAFASWADFQDAG